MSFCLKRDFVYEVFLSKSVSMMRNEVLRCEKTPLTVKKLKKIVFFKKKSGERVQKLVFLNNILVDVLGV